MSLEMLEPRQKHAPAPPTQNGADAADEIGGDLTEIGARLAALFGGEIEEGHRDEQSGQEAGTGRNPARARARRLKRRHGVLV